MIFKALEYIRIKLNEFLRETIPGEGNVVLENIAKMEDSEFRGKDKVVVSLVNVEEESALKNHSSHRTVTLQTNDSTRRIVEYERPPIRLNLYILFSANLTSYRDSLKALSQVVEFFQGQKIFRFKSDPVDPELAEIEASGFTERDQDSLDLRFDLYTMTFEQLNHLWGALGGKQVPSVLFKMRLVEIKGDRLLDTSGVIERIRTEDNALS